MSRRLLIALVVLLVAMAWPARGVARGWTPYGRPAEVVRWARALPESDGRVGLFGPSYMAIMQVLHDKRHPSYVELPTLGSRCDRARCASLPVPDMTRG